LRRRGEGRGEFRHGGGAGNLDRRRCLDALDHGRGLARAEQIDHEHTSQPGSQECENYQQDGVPIAAHRHPLCDKVVGLSYREVLSILVVDLIPACPPSRVDARIEAYPGRELGPTGLESAYLSGFLSLLV
jgi:hypothetical protein